MENVFFELNGDGVDILKDKYGDDVEVTESGIVDCRELKISKVDVLDKDRVLKNVTFDLNQIDVADVVVSGHEVSTVVAQKDLDLKAYGDLKLSCTTGVVSLGTSTRIDCNGNNIQDIGSVILTNGLTMFSNTISTVGANSSLTLVTNNTGGVKFGTISTPIQYYSESTLTPTNSVPSDNANVGYLSFDRAVHIRQLHRTVDIYGSFIFTPTQAGQSTYFKVQFLTAPIPSDASDFYGSGQFQYGAISQGTSGNFGVEVVQTSPLIVRFNCHITYVTFINLELAPGRISFSLTYRTADNINL